MHVPSRITDFEGTTIFTQTDTTHTDLSVCPAVGGSNAEPIRECFYVALLDKHVKRTLTALLGRAIKSFC